MKCPECGQDTDVEANSAGLIAQSAEYCPECGQRVDA